MHSPSKSVDETTQEGVPAARAATEPTTTAAPEALAQRLIKGMRARFRLHTDEHTAPGTPRLLGMTLVAAVCVFVGLIPAARLVASVALGGPWWYPVAALALGTMGAGLIAAAFAAIHRAFLPWYLMGLAVLLLAANVAMVYVI